jgi:hypothetical protein
VQRSRFLVVQSENTWRARRPHALSANGRERVVERKRDGAAQQGPHERADSTEAFGSGDPTTSPGFDAQRCESSETPLAARSGSA